MNKKRQFIEVYVTVDHINYRSIVDYIKSWIVWNPYSTSFTQFGY